MFKILSNPKVVAIWYSILSGSRAMYFLYLTSKVSFQELYFNRELISKYNFYIILSITLSIMAASKQ